jgi:peroxidase
VAQQFRDLKIGDRFYFENGHDNVTRFSLPQLTQLRRSTMARILCDSLDLKFVQRRAFSAIAQDDNPLVPCSRINKAGLKHWRDEPLFQPTTTTASPPALDQQDLN